MRVENDERHLHDEAAQEYHSIDVHAASMSESVYPPAAEHDEVGEEAVHNALDDREGDEGEQLQAVQ